MHRFLPAIVTLAVATIPLSSAARAEDSQESEAVPGGLPRPIDHNREVWSRYHTAEDDLALGRTEDALRALEAIRAENPDHPAAAAALVLIQRTEAKDDPPAAPAKPAAVVAVEPQDPGRALRDEKTTGLARAELAAGQTLNGAIIAGAMCDLFGCSDVRAFAGSLMLGAGSGLVLSLVLTSDGLTPGHAASLNHGAAWGLWNGVALSVGVPSSVSQSGIGGAILLGSLAGLGTGEVLYRSFHPSAGDVSIATSAGLWSAVLFNLALGTAQTSIDPRAQVLLTLVVSDAALLGGAFLADAVPMSRGRALLIDIGGGVGLLMGAGGALLAGGEHTSSDLIFGLGAAGTFAGLGLTWLLTRSWDVNDVPVQVGVAPTRGGGAAVLAFSL
jgi:hypothetical protein